ncbi:hypothetical protein K431DRAFT_282953 [Polychaeton citri CBS 116435]|uniref:WDR59/RTC1-like RING zinc finger domain-containing protein n=1 Tax=Polychaeton citri CBS 116435 TaxID=1314669 RepID=A0A9P4UPJ0_9PEZI|nr:hypothetical protein K431DRAFT_282953 [Polychaeton citri CBS 116435]
MSQDSAFTSRKVVPLATATPIPRAPPLPAPRPFQKARIAAKGFFRSHTRPPSPQDGIANGERFTRSSISARKPSLGVSEDASTIHRTGLEIKTLSINERGTHALLGGKEIFKTLRIEDGDDGPKCVEEINLKTAIKSNPTQASGQLRQVYSIDIADVAWANGDCGDYVAAATSSGKIILYDLGRAGLPAAQLYEHSRQVHRVTFNPHRGNLLLSGSQDGSVRLWDLRDIKREAATLHSKRKYSGQSDGVRDVKWSPTDGVDFAFGTDGGWLQRWDLRDLKTAKAKIPAHARSCNSVDWHPDGKHLVSASTDQTVKVWDINDPNIRKASWEIKAPHAVLHTRFRPTCESYMPGDDGARLCTQIATTYSREYPHVHIWDFRRPYLPFRELVPYSSAPTDFLWHSQDLLWTVGKEGTFLQSDIQHTRKVISRRNLQALSISTMDEITSVTQTRKRDRPPPRRETKSSISELERMSKSLSISPETSFLSRSLGDDTLDHLFLRSKSRVRRKSSTHSKTPSNGGATMPVIRLDEVLMNRKSFRPRQAAVRGNMVPSADRLSFHYLAGNYSMDLSSIRTTQSNQALLISSVLKRNAEQSTKAGLYKTAQTWKILGFLVASHLEHRTAPSGKSKNRIRRIRFQPPDDPRVQTIAKRLLAKQVRSPNQQSAASKPISNLTQQLHAPEGSSNNPTPLTRPVTNASSGLPDPNLGDALVLPPSLSEYPGAHPPGPGGRPGAGRKLTSSNLNLHQLNSFRSSTSRVDMIHKWSMEDRSIASARVSNIESSRTIPLLEKHHSDESFRFLEDSTDSRGPSWPASFDSAASGGLDLVAERPSRGLAPAPAVKDVELSDGQLDDNQKKHPGNSHHKDGTVLGHDSAISPLKSLQAEHIEPYNAVVHGGSPVKPPLRPPQKLQSVLHQQYDSGDNEGLPPKPIVEAENNKPFALVEALRDLARYYTNQLPDAQMLTHIMCLVPPLLPRNSSLSHSVVEDVISHYIDVFSTIGYTNTELPNMLDALLGHDLDAGLVPIQLEAIMATYHQQLLNAGLLNEATSIRKLSFPQYPDVYQGFTKDNFLHFMCGECGKVVQEGLAQGRCENCASKMGSCVICWSTSSPFTTRADPADEEQPKMAATNPDLLTVCLLCGHLGHAACLREWYIEEMEHSEGACPSEGCLCDCTKGTWRKEKRRLLMGQSKTESKQQTIQSPGLVRLDEWRAKESRAVKRTGANLGGHTKRNGNVPTKST